jgi:CheY-like chemotaxis protein
VVRDFQPVNRRDDWITWRLVRYLADCIGKPGKQRDRKDMSKIIEADFLPRETNVAFLGPGSMGHWGTKERVRVRILIVDNDRDTTHLVKVLLERTGHYLVLEENDATKAHQSALNFRPDLILLDIVMPETDVGEVALRIEADPALKNTPIIFLTALVTRAEAKSLNIQRHSFLAKPVSIPELIKAIEEHLAARAASSVSL